MKRFWVDTWLAIWVMTLMGCGAAFVSSDVKQGVSEVSAAVSATVAEQAVTPEATTKSYQMLKKVDTCLQNLVLYLYSKSPTTSSTTTTTTTTTTAPVAVPTSPATEEKK